LCRPKYDNTSCLGRRGCGRLQLGKVAGKGRDSDCLYKRSKRSAESIIPALGGDPNREFRRQD
jgi:hypothetical protein